MLAQKVNGELLVTLALLVAFVARAVENNAVIGQFIHETAAQQSAGEGRAKSTRPSAKRYARGFSNVHLFICTISASEARGCESKREAPQPR